MSDLALIFDPDALDFDIALTAVGDLQAETGLATAIYLSLFTDAPARPGDVIPDGSTDGRGWWGDYTPRFDGDRIGSRLWLLERAKRTAENIRLVQDYGAEALQWLVTDGVASTVSVTAVARGSDAVKLTVVVTAPDGKNSQFHYVWDGLNG